MSSGIDHHEISLLQRLANGDDTAFDALFLKHWDPVFSTAVMMTKSREIANDIAQDAFVVIWNNRRNLDTIGNFEGYLCTIVKFIVHKRLRRMKVEDAYANYLSSKVSGFAFIPEQEASVSLKQLQESIKQGISKLPPQQQRAFLLSREGGLSHDQISELMGVSKKTVKDYIVRAIAYLRPYAEHLGCIVAFGFLGWY